MRRNIPITSLRSDDDKLSVVIFGPSTFHFGSVQLISYNVIACILVTEKINTFLLFPQKFDVWPGLVRVDYMPCRVDLAALRGGKYVELVNLVPWKVNFQSFGF